MPGNAQQQARNEIAHQCKRQRQRHAKHEGGLKHDAYHRAVRDQPFEVLLQGKRKRRHQSKAPESSRSDRPGRRISGTPPMNNQRRHQQRTADPASQREPREVPVPGLLQHKVALIGTRVDEPEGKPMRDFSPRQHQRHRQDPRGQTPPHNRTVPSHNLLTPAVARSTARSTIRRAVRPPSDAEAPRRDAPTSQPLRAPAARRSRPNRTPPRRDWSRQPRTATPIPVQPRPEAAGQPLVSATRGTDPRQRQQDHQRQPEPLAHPIPRSSPQAGPPPTGPREERRVTIRAPACQERHYKESTR